jgi:hypothetical protein
MRYTRSLVITLAVTFVVGEASAGLDVFVYPSKGQTKDAGPEGLVCSGRWIDEHQSPRRQDVFSDASQQHQRCQQRGKHGRGTNRLLPLGRNAVQPEAARRERVGSGVISGPRNGGS